jgi:hypothetical protein
MFGLNSSWLEKMIGSNLVGHLFQKMNGLERNKFIKNSKLSLGQT